MAADKTSEKFWHALERGIGNWFVPGNHPDPQCLGRVAKIMPLDQFFMGQGGVEVVVMSAHQESVA